MISAWMVSASSSSKRYDVFLSFRGSDTRMNFASHLHDALTREGIRTFIDEKTIGFGKYIATELPQAIEASRFAVVVLSSEFATSKWCLDEIAKVVDCKEKAELTVVPVFYHVNPSDVRNQTSNFADAFSKHEKDPEIAPEKVETWRKAFTKVGAMTGFHVEQHKCYVIQLSYTSVALFTYIFGVA